MQYLLLPNESAAQERSAEIATALNCEPTTPYWYGWQLHPSTGEAALQISDEVGRAYLTPDELGQLVDVLPDGWVAEDMDA